MVQLRLAFDQWRAAQVGRPDHFFSSVEPEHRSLPADGVGVAPEGNAHQAEFTGDNAFVIAADEDFSPYALTAENTTGTPSHAGMV